MLRKFYSLTVLVLAFATGLQANLQNSIDQATTAMREFKDSAIPQEVLDQAKGIAVLNLVKAGFIIGGEGGDGLVVARTSKGWSAPSSIGMGSASIGFQAGVEAIDFVLILNTQEAVDRFARGGQLSLGADIGVAAGPVGGTAELNIVPMPAIYSYSMSKGVFAGVSLEGTVIVEGSDANADYYGKPVTAAELLSGKIPPPEGAKALYAELNTTKKSEENIPSSNKMATSILIAFGMGGLALAIRKRK